jgi:hypothetical protein
MLDLMDATVAQDALRDPHTSSADLAFIAENHPSLRLLVAHHGEADPALLDWLKDLGDPAVSAAVQYRQALAARPVPSTLPTPTQPEFLPIPESSSTESSALDAHAEPRPALELKLTGAPSGMTRSRRRLIAIVSCVVALTLLVTGFVVVVLPRIIPPNPWTQVLDNSPPYMFSSVAVADNGDIIAAGVVRPIAASPDDYRGIDAVIALFAASGDLLWSKTYGGNDTDWFGSVAIAGNGDIIAVGFTDSSDGDFPTTHDGSDALVARISPKGNLLWAKTLGGDSWDIFESVAIADNGDIIAVGSTYSLSGDFATTHTLPDAVVARLSPTGDLLWANTRGDGRAAYYFSDVAVAGNGDIIAVGCDDSAKTADMACASETANAVVARISATGDFLWVKEIGSALRYRFTSLALADNGDIIAAGDGTTPTGLNNGDAAIARISATGDILWTKAYGGFDADGFTSVALAKNGDIIAVGYTISTNGDFRVTHDGPDAVVAGISATGELLWANTYGGSRIDLFNSVALAKNGDIIAVGYTTSLDGDFPTTLEVGAVVARFTPKGEL